MAGGSRRTSKRNRDNTSTEVGTSMRAPSTEEIKAATAMLIAAASQSLEGGVSISSSTSTYRGLPSRLGSSDVEDEGHDSDDDEEKILVGFVEVNIVGLQYYYGTVNNKEMVRLIREPFNSYDRNAIRVENMRGEQVGHVERYKACYLSPLLDDEYAIMEGVIPRGSKNAYKMPCQVFIFSKHQLMATVLNNLRRSGLSVVTPNEPEFDKISAIDFGDDDKEKENAGNKSVDDIFDSLILNQGKVSFPSMDPSPIVTTPLYSHQKEALAWLVGRENSTDLPPFWKEQVVKNRGNKLFYVNSLTNFMTEERPEPFRGGILADEMGLGKTLTLVSLIATNKPDMNSKHISGGQSAGAPSSRPSKKKKLDDLGFTRLDSKVPKCTLVVCPLSVMSIWVSQLEEHTLPGSLKVYLYHGPERTKKATVLSSYDIVLTTYNLLGTEADDNKSPLKKVKWLRIILDEAHIVKNPSARMTKTVISLNAERRWAVTGTPIQNGAKDLCSLMMFLKLQPLDDKSFWNRTIQRPLMTGDTSGYLRLQALLMTIALRRTKDMKVDDKKLVELPRRTVSIYSVDLTSEDRTLYDRMELEGKRLVGQYVASGTVLQNYTTILQIIMRLRQICDHSSLCPLKEGFMDAVSNLGDISSSPELLQKLLAVLQSGDDFDCPICLSPPTMAVITKCSHVYCRKCIERTLEKDKQKCPMCRLPITMSDLFASPEAETQVTQVPENAQPESSAKINALIQLLKEVRDKDPTIKSVVFSQFAGMLNIAQESLLAAGFKCVRIDGSMSLKKREAAIRAFQSKDAGGPSVFLLSLKAAGVGLNLVAASRVYMLDPWWNPAIEEQAMDRVHRLGQTRDVEIVRLIVSDSIEERILALQEKKRNLANSAFKKSADEMRQNRIQDVQHLMQL